VRVLPASSVTVGGQTLSTRGGGHEDFHWSRK
jgi:hypothetical protein